MEKGKRRDLFYLALWMLVAAALFGLYFGTTFQALHRSIDGCGYAASARSIIRGEGCLPGWAPTVNYARYAIGEVVEPSAGFGTRRSYLWPLVLAFFFVIFGLRDSTVALAGGFFFALTIPFLYLSAKRLFSDRAAHIGCALAVFNAIFLSYTLSGTTEIFLFFLMACAVFFASGKGTPGSSIGFGLMLFLAALTKSTGLLWTAPLLLLALSKGEKKGIRFGLIAGTFLVLMVFSHLIIQPLLGKQKTVAPRQRITSTWAGRANEAAGLEEATISEPGAPKDRSFLLDWIVRSPLGSVILVHSPDFPDHSYARGLKRPDRGQVVASNFSAYVERMKVNLRRIVATVFWQLTNPLLVLLGWVGILGFLFVKRHRIWSASVLVCLVLAPLPNMLTFAWPRYLHPALLFFILSAAGFLGSVSQKIPKAKFRIPVLGLIVLCCSLPLGFTAGIDSLASEGRARQTDSGLLSFLVRASDPHCLQHRLASREFAEKLTILFRERVPAGATVTSDIPAVAVWYGDRPAVWLPNDEETLVQLLARVNIDYLVLLFQFERESYNRYWRDWLVGRAKGEGGESGIQFMTGVPTDIGSMYLFSTGIAYTESDLR